MKMAFPLKIIKNLALKEVFLTGRGWAAVLALFLFTLMVLLGGGSRADDLRPFLAPEPGYRGESNWGKQVNSNLGKDDLTRKVAELSEKNAELERTIKRLSKKVEPSTPKIGQVAADQAGANVSSSYGPRLPLSAYKLPPKVFFAGKEVPLDKWDVRERLELEFYNFLDDQARLLLLMKKNKRYFPVIERQLRDNKLPLDLKYLAVVESWLNERAYSSAGAVGVWQFIKATGERFGLYQSAWRDERRDLEKATSSAISYLKNLHSRFGDWPLAMAAYNAGEARVQKEMSAQGVNNYYQLALPIETERYVFKIIASRIIFSEPEKYGILLEDGEYFPPREAEKVKINVTGRRLNLSQIAEAAGSYFREIKLLNPEILGDSIPRGEHYVFIPKAGKERFLKNFNPATIKHIEKEDELIPKKRDSIRSRTADRASSDGKKVKYAVKKGDTLSGIAARHGVDLNQLLAWNSLTKKDKLAPGQTITIYK